MKKQARHKKKQSYKAVARVLVTLLILITGLIAYYSIRGGDRTLLMVFHSEKQVADTSGAWNLILVDRDHYIPANYRGTDRIIQWGKGGFKDLSGATADV